MTYEQGSTIVFHYPGRLSQAPSKGSEIRPVRMIESFEHLGHEVIPVLGTSRERNATIDSLKEQVRRGRTIDFLYAEALTIPTALSDPDHVPRHPILDLEFMRWLRRRGTKTGLFYRDVHWRFPLYRAASPNWAKRNLTIAAYRLELIAYRSALDVLFVPHEAMAGWMPGLGNLSVEPLPPGGDLVDLAHVPGDDRLRLLHVGSAAPPIYELDPLIRAVATAGDIELTIACPEDHESFISPMPSTSTSRLTVTRATSAEAVDLYRRTDAATLIYGPHHYREFAVPIKLFEATGLGVPTIGMQDTAAGDLIHSAGLGWTVGPRNDDLVALLRQLSHERELVERARERVIDERSAHSWDARADQALDALRRTRFEDPNS